MQSYLGVVYDLVLNRVDQQVNFLKWCALQFRKLPRQKMRWEMDITLAKTLNQPTIILFFFLTHYYSNSGFICVKSYF